MSSKSTRIRHRIVVLALALVSALSLAAAPTVASPAVYPSDGSTHVEAENGDWPW